MRHGSVDYFTADGTPVPPHTVPLNEAGRAQADAAGALFAAAGVRFDRVLVSGLARTVETAQRVLAAAGQDVADRPRRAARGDPLRPPRRHRRPTSCAPPSRASSAPPPTSNRCSSSAARRSAR